MAVGTAKRMRILNEARNALSTFNRWAGEACRLASQTFLAAMTAVILLQVFRRYVLGSPLIWAEEAARYMMVWMTFLIFPVVYRGDLLVRLDSLLERLPAGARRKLEFFLHGLIAATSIVLVREGIWMVARGSRFDSSALGIPMSWVFAILPISFALVSLVAVEKMAGPHAPPDGQESDESETPRLQPGEG